jgi:hypothetical protein
MSQHTPQKGEPGAEVLKPEIRARVIEELSNLRERFPKLNLPRSILDVYRKPPASPSECMFARSTRTITADLKNEITPCQIGGNPDCSQCGCMASAGMEAIAAHRLPGGIQIRTLYNIADAVGRRISASARVRQRQFRHSDPLPAGLPGDPR